MKMMKGKRTKKGDDNFNLLFWGGCLFVNLASLSFMIHLSDWQIDLLLFLGFDPYGD